LPSTRLPKATQIKRTSSRHEILVTLASKHTQEIKDIEKEVLIWAGHALDEHLIGADDLLLVEGFLCCVEVNTRRRKRQAIYR